MEFYPEASLRLTNGIHGRAPGTNSMMVTYSSASASVCSVLDPEKRHGFVSTSMIAFVYYNIQSLRVTARGMISSRNRT